jgi:hypothetical protein
MTRKEPIACCSALHLLHLLLFVAFLVAWTVVLLLPVPKQSAEEVLGNPFTVFMFGKGLHIAAYAFLTLLGGTAAILGSRWIWVLPALIVHGGLAEIAQGLVGRTSRIEDVGLDALGVCLGALVVVGYRRLTRSADAAGSSSLESAGCEAASPPHRLPSVPPNPPSSAAGY